MFGIGLLCVGALLIGVAVIGSGDLLDTHRITFGWVKTKEVLAASNPLVLLLATVAIILILVSVCGGKRFGPWEIPKIEPRWKRIVTTLTGLAIIAALLSNFIGRPEITITSRISSAVLSRLSRIEDERNGKGPFSRDDSKADTSLTALFLAANESLVSRLTAAANSGEGGMIIVTAPGGFGKSFLADKLQQLFPNELKIYRLRPLGEKTAADLVFRSDKPLVLNTLVDIPNVPEPDLVSFLSNKADLELSSLTVVDDFDEVDPEDAKRILQNLASLSSTKAKGKMVLVFGRPEAFVPFITDPYNGLRVPVERLALNPPVYSRFAHIETLANDYFGREKRTPPPEVASKLEALLVKHHYMKEMLLNLSQANELLKYARDTSSERIDAVDEQSLKNYMFDQILTRNRETHGRPTNGTVHFSTYERAFHAAAAESLVDLDDDGFFGVSALREITFRSPEGIFTANLQTLLNRSGLVEAEPIDSTRTKYRFYPFWVHRHLVQSYNSGLGGLPLIRSALLSLGFVVILIALPRKSQSSGPDNSRSAEPS